MAPHDVGLLAKWDLAKWFQLFLYAHLKMLHRNSKDMNGLVQSSYIVMVDVLIHANSDPPV